MWRLLKQFWSKSIGRQLMLGIALVHAILMTIFVYDLVSRQRGFLVEESRKQAVSLAEALAANGTSWMLARDFLGIEEVIRSQQRFPGLRYALFIDPRGQVMGYTDRSRVGMFVRDPISLRLLQAPLATQVLIDDAQHIDVAQPIMIDQRHIGWARVGISREGISENLRIVTHEGFLYTMIAIAVGVVFAWGMSRGLTRDIRTLADSAKRIECGERDIACQLDRPDELGRLAWDMNQMLETLIAREREIVEINVRVRADEERLRHALEGSNDGLWDWDLVTNEVYYSPRWKEMLGFREEELSNTYQSWQERIHPDDRPTLHASIQTHLADPSKTFEVLHRVRHKNGEWRWILSRGRARLNTQLQPVRMVGTHADVTERKRLESILYEERERALVTLRSIGDGVVTTDAEGKVTFINPVAENLTKWQNREAEGCHFEKILPIIDESSRESLGNLVEHCQQKRQVIAYYNNTLLLNRHGNEIAVAVSAAPILRETGEVSGVVMVFHDVSAARALQRKIEFQAMHDSLTKLLNREVFDRSLQEKTLSALQGEGSHVLIYIDLDQFKVVNDTVGHIAGDELLKQVATLLQKQSRDSDVLARLGGDEFGLLLVGCDLEHGKKIAEHLRVQLSNYPFTWENQHFQIGASFGLVVIDSSLPESNALGLADLACYSAKEQGRNQVHVYQAGDRQMTERRGEMQMVTRIREALNDGRLMLYSQSMLPLSRDPGSRDFREVLVRMIDEEGELIMPGEFIPAAERFDIMSQVDQWVIQAACDWLLSSENSRVHLFINLSGGSLANSNVLKLIERRLNQNPDLGERISLEITETAAISNLHKALTYMERLKLRRVTFALDDFGSGLSSFNYLKTLPVDYVKIDGCFVRNLLDNPVDAAMVESICRISSELGLETIAEFVEDTELIEWLVSVGVDYAQGYVIDQPQPLLDRDRLEIDIEPQKGSLTAS